MNLLQIQRRRRAANKGFNLIEAAIVLGIVGLVVGGIWVAATSVYANLRTKQATDQLLQIAQSMRSLYATQVNAANAAAVNITTSVATVFPADMLRVNPPTAAGDTLNPWSANGGANVMIGHAAANATTFFIGYGSVPRSACVDLISRNSGISGLTGITVSSKAAAAAIALAVTAPAGTAVTLPATPVNAATACSNAFNDIYWTFSLRG